MQIITLNKAKQKRYKGLSIALGAFDGLHLGHMALINAVIAAPGQSAVLTFEPLPAEYFGTRAQRLFTQREKEDALQRAGIDIMCTADFDDAFAAVDADIYVRLIAQTFSPSVVVAGYNYTYGHHAEGNAQLLEKSGEKLGFDVRVISPVIFDGSPVSSSRIRACLENGDADQAARLLGRPYAIDGIVGKGRGVGSSRLGFPTANLIAPVEKMIPRHGVYSVETDYQGKTYKGVCNIGTNPTVSQNGQRSIEIHILSLKEDLYGQRLSVRFIKRLRDEKKFGSLEQLKKQICQDIESI